jgi:hypothetical protein
MTPYSFPARGHDVIAFRIVLDPRDRLSGVQDQDAVDPLPHPPDVLSAPDRVRWWETGSLEGHRMGAGMQRQA